jgi:SH3 domain-containing YSC84-like protein 1
MPFSSNASRVIAHLFVIIAGAVGIVPAAAAQTEQEKLVVAAEKTFDNFVRDPDMTWIQQNIGRAKAVLVAPSILKAGFILGGSGGRAVLLAADPRTGKWNGPAFYSLVTGSVGFQAGIEVSEAVMLVMTDKGLNSLLGGSFKLGAEVGVAAGPVGAGAKSSIQSDIVSYSRAKGIYGGLNFDGTVVHSSLEWNQSYYKRTASATDILVRNAVSSAHAEKLLAAVTGAAGKK